MDLASLIILPALADVVLPAQHGQVAVTHRALMDDSDQLDAGGAVLTLLDVRLPPDESAAWPMAGVPWTPPADSNLPSENHAWTLENLGLVLGVACESLDAPAPALFVAACPWAYGDHGADPLAAGPAGPGGIHTVSLIDGTIASLVPGGLPNGGPGLGGLCWHGMHNQLFATNLDDGRIWRIARDGTVLDAYDPFDEAQDADSTFAPLGDRTLGVAVNNDRLYFSTWLRDAARGDTSWPESAGPAPSEPNNAIWSVALNDSGAPEGTPVLEVTLPWLDGETWSHPVWSITFDDHGSMLLAQRPCAGDIGAPEQAPRAQVLEYVQSDGTWSPSPRHWHVGETTSSDGMAGNASGGIAVACNGHPWTTASDVLSGAPGLTRLPVPGNTHDTRLSTSLPVPMPGVVMGNAVRIGPAPCATKTGACCIEATAACVEVTWDECSEVFGGVWNGLGTLCGEIPCGPVIEGACCLHHPDGPFCGGFMAEDYCTVFGGIWMGPGTDCDTSDCVDPFRGACCIWIVDEGVRQCQWILPEACDAAGGDFAGSQTTCDTHECCTTGSPCHAYLTTGEDLNTPIDIGAQDDQWGVVAVPFGDPTPGAAIAVAPEAHWDVADDGRWINATGSVGPPGLTTYICEFRLDLSVGTPVLDLFFAADDAATITLNDIVVLETDPASSGLEHDILTTDEALFLDGCNTMLVHVENLEGPTGFQATGLVALCRVGDINGDGRVTVADLLLLLAAWGPCDGCAADLNEDGVVGVNDVLLLLGGWDP